jgi:hypothetical protein
MWAGAGNFSQALETVRHLNYHGMSGHLVTITSEEEFNFLISINFTSGYVGASDQDTEGVFRWVTGPDAGVLLPNVFWSPEEPNNWESGEDCVEFEGKLNDIDCDSQRNWFIEFECQSDSARNFTCPSKSCFIILQVCICLRSLCFSSHGYSHNHHKNQ